jgi:regulator of cell morphogenesis and NO signaling
MDELYNKTIREIAVEYPQTTRVFEEFKIDYCCGGGRNFSDACHSAGIAPSVVSRKIEEQVATPHRGNETDLPERKTLSDLSDHIIRKHHVFTTNETARLTNLAEKVCRKHGHKHQELFDLQETFRLLAEELAVHMRKEEMVLFPYIRSLEAAVMSDLSVEEPHFKTVRNPVRMMMTEHDAAGDLLSKLRQISNDYALPEGACASFRALYYGLEDLEKDLHRHIHLENNILFPRAIEIEKDIFGEHPESALEEDYVCHRSACS